MDKRIRSPNYPALSLPEALEKVAILYRNQHTHAAPREVAVKSMGYNTLNGASATAISALHKYGLLEKVGDEVKVGERALRIMHPNSPEERQEAIREAANEPALFVELNERFPGPMPSDEVLRNYLIRKGFAPAALSHVLLAYRKTSELARQEGAPYDSAPSVEQEPAPMTPATAMQPARPQAPAIIPQTPENERRIGILDLGGGDYVKIMATVGVTDAEALEWAEEIVATQKRVQSKRGAARPAVRDTDNAQGENKDD